MGQKLEIERIWVKKMDNCFFGKSFHNKNEIYKKKVKDDLPVSLSWKLAAAVDAFEDNFMFGGRTGPAFRGAFFSSAEKNILKNKLIKSKNPLSFCLWWVHTLYKNIKIRDGWLA